MSELHQQSCQPIAKDDNPLDKQQISDYLQKTPGWNQTGSNQNDSQQIQRKFTFKDYYQTIAFVNAVAWIVQQNDHHPDMQIGYNNCIITFTTHSVNGLTINDFICAAKINNLL